MTIPENTSDRDPSTEASEVNPSGFDKQNQNRTYGSSKDQRDMRDTYSGAGEGFSQDRDQDPEGLSDKSSQAIENVNTNSENWEIPEEESQDDNLSKDRDL